MKKNNNKTQLPRMDKHAEKFINYIMKHGKKSVAQKIFDMSMQEIKKQWHMNPLVVLKTAIENSSPNIMIKSTRIWWSVYQIPVEVKTSRKLFLSCKWMLDAAKSKKWKPMYKKITEEILSTYNWQSVATKKKEEVQKMADANKAFAYMAKYVK